MLAIRNAAEMAAALASHLDDELTELLTRHRDNLAEYGDFDVGELAFFVIVDAEDTPVSVAAALGFDPTHDGESSQHFGGCGSVPLWETLTHHDAWTEVVFVLGDDGFGCVLLLPRTSDIHPSLAALRRQPAISGHHHCRGYANENCQS